jgi:cysteine synthase A
VIFNQFEEWGNAQWHYTADRRHRAGDLREDRAARRPPRGLDLGHRLGRHHGRRRPPQGRASRRSLITASEALQCPTLLRCGFGGHRIEGIGDKHVPWIHNVRNTDFIAAVDDQQCMDLLRLCNEPAGRETLEREGVPAALVAQLPLLGISSLSNLVSAIKTARHYDLDGRDVLFTPLTDSSELYASRLVELRAAHGEYRREDALRHLERWLRGITPDHVRELNYQDRKQLHNFKYFTWVEQQGKTSEELNQLWSEDFWQDVFAPEQVAEWDRLIEQFNEATGLLKKL